MRSLASILLLLLATAPVRAQDLAPPPPPVVVPPAVNPPPPDPAIGPNPRPTLVRLPDLRDRLRSGRHLFEFDVTVDATGRVTGVARVKADDEAAAASFIKALGDWEFVPGEAGAGPVTSRFRFAVTSEPYTERHSDALGRTTVTTRTDLTQVTFSWLGHTCTAPIPAGRSTYAVQPTLDWRAIDRAATFDLLLDTSGNPERVIPVDLRDIDLKTWLGLKLRDMKFKPASVDGHPVRFWMEGGFRLGDIDPSLDLPLFVERFQGGDFARFRIAVDSYGVVTRARLVDSNNRRLADELLPRLPGRVLRGNNSLQYRDHECLLLVSVAGDRLVDSVKQIRSPAQLDIRDDLAWVFQGWRQDLR